MKRSKVKLRFTGCEPTFLAYDAEAQTFSVRERADALSADQGRWRPDPISDRLRRVLEGALHAAEEESKMLLEKSDKIQFRNAED